MHQPNKLRNILPVSGLIIAMILPSGLALSNPVEQGPQEETSSRMEMPGNSFTPSSMTFGQCLTKQVMAPEQKNSQEKCAITDTKIPGDTVDWTVKAKIQKGPR